MNSLSFLNNILTIIKTAGANKSFEGPNTIEEDFEVSGNDYKCDWLIFNKTTFLSRIIISDATIGTGLKFIDCVFQGDLVFTNISAEGSDTNFDTLGRNLVFSKCKFESKFRIVGKASPILINGKIQFFECTFNSTASIENISIKDSGLVFGSCIFNHHVDLKKITAKDDVTIELSVFNEYVSIGDIEASTLVFYNCKTFNRLVIMGGGFNFRLWFDSGEYNDEVSISHLKSFGGLVFENAVFKDAVSVSFYSLSTKWDRAWTKKGALETKLKEVFIKNTNFQNGLSFFGSAEHTIIEKITLVFTTKLQGDISFSRLIVGLLRLQGLNTKSNLALTDVEVSVLKMENFHNQASIVFTRLKAFDSSKDGYIGDVFKMLGAIIPTTNDSQGQTENIKETVNIKSLFLAFQCNFGRTYFNQVEFSTFQTVVLREVSLAEITASNTKWFHPSALEINHDFLGMFRDGSSFKSNVREDINIYSLFENSKTLPTDDVYAAKKDIYRQLKAAMQKQNDFPTALEFQKNEMLFYNKILSNQNPINWSERLILWSNQSNDFGQNWIKAAKLLFVFSFFIFIPIGFLNSIKLNYSKFAASWQDVFLNLKVVFVDNLKYWLVVMNPAHSLKDITSDPSRLSGWIYFWDFLSRIIVSYFLFQIVSAFRKFNK